LLLNVCDYVVRQKQRNKLSGNNRDLDAFLPELLKQLAPSWTFVNPRKKVRILWRAQSALTHYTKTGCLCVSYRQLKATQKHLC
jgi:aspartokinase-like uncharacterized kinase